MEKDQSIGPKVLTRKHGPKIGIEFLKVNRKAKLMSSGIKVLIKSKDTNGKPIIEYGYIINRLDAHCYHIIGEDSNQEYFLNKDEFQEIQEDNLLYGIRDKIR